jgi:hypothetical protein
VPSAERVVVLGHGLLRFVPTRLHNGLGLRPFLDGLTRDGPQ